MIGFPAGEGIIEHHPATPERTLQHHPLHRRRFDPEPITQLHTTNLGTPSDIVTEYQHARHNVTALHVHMVFVTKYRRRVFTNPILTRCEHIMRNVCDELGATLDEFNGEADHVHLLITYPPTLAISTLAMRLKGRAAHTIRAENRLHISTLRMNGHLWSPAYFAASAGGAPLATIKQCIDNQARPTQ